jgi:hypothetical protein
LQNDIASYQQQVNQGQSMIGSLDTKIQELHTEIPKLEETAKLAPEPVAESVSVVRTNQTPAARQKATQQPTPKSEPPLPWYGRAWKWISSFWK